MIFWEELSVKNINLHIFEELIPIALNAEDILIFGKSKWGGEYFLYRSHYIDKFGSFDNTIECINMKEKFPYDRIEKAYAHWEIDKVVVLASLGDRKTMVELKVNLKMMSCAIVSETHVVE